MRIYSSLNSVLREYILAPHDFSENQVVVPDYDPYEKAGGEFVRGHMIALKDCRIKEAHFTNSFIYLENTVGFTILNCTFYELRGLGFLFSDRQFKTAALEHSSFRNI